MCGAGTGRKEQAPMTEDAAETIVVVDDDYAMRLSCERILSKTGFAVHTFEDGARGLAAVADLRPALVLVDLKMPGLSGMEVIPRIREIDPTAVIVVITGYATIATAVDAMKAGAYDFLPKPFSPDELRLIVRRGLERRRLELDSRQCEIERELMKRRFVSFVSHQLKTPLVAVHQYLEVLGRLGDTPDMSVKAREWIGRCLARTDEMRQLIDDWLTLSRIEGGSLGRQRADADLHDTLTHLIESYRPAAGERRITLALDAARPLPVHADPTCLTVLFDNLIGNAVKYNRDGGAVEVVAERSDGEILVTVRDTGVGIPADALPLLFEEFYRVPREGAPVPGTGLGLPIARRIALELGGTITVESTEGEGTTFQVRLPRRLDEPAPGEEVP
jgi:signal transduction histidine kinase